MAQTVIDWLFTAGSVSNEDGTHEAIVEGANEVPGPGDTPLGSRPTALSFGTGASCKMQLSPGSVDATRFAIRIVFRVTSTVSTRGNLVESTALPFALFVEPGAAADRFNLAASVANSSAGWAGANSYNRKNLALNQWHTASLVYDIDTLALMVDDEVISLSAFPGGGLQAPGGDQIFAGTWTDGVRWPFVGDIAGLQVWNDIPENLESKLDLKRGTAEWHLTRKENELKPSLNLGPKTADYYFDPGTQSYIQSYSLAVISYTEAHGTAFVMYGTILVKWRTDENLRRQLGPLVSDEIAGRRPGSRKSVFEKGCIYWSPTTGAHPVLDRMYLNYDMLGEGGSAIGLPIADAENISGGKSQQFQGGRMYLRSGASNAFEVHGAILAKYVAAGGPARFGFPITHESDVKMGSTVIGKVSEFERCTIYWSPRTPASIVYGGIRDRYRGAPLIPGEGGPLGQLGFPTSDEEEIPGSAGNRYNTFENGSILWFGGGAVVCLPFSIMLGRLDTKEEDRDLLDLDGENDLYCRVCVEVNGGRVFDRKYPEGNGSYPSANIRDLNLKVPYTITPNSPNMQVRVRVEVWESDNGNLFGGGDDHLGTLTHDLNISNGWGLKDTNGIFRASNFGPWVNYLDWSVKPVTSPSTPYDFWGVRNIGTPIVDWREYAAAFSDVDPDFEIDFGIIDAGLKAAFYELVVKNIAAGGNCYGMSLEAIYAWKEQSRLGRPLSRFNNWSQVENDFNVKQTYQVGANAIWWFLGQFVGGNTHNPKAVFQATWDASNRGENPVVCIAQNADFSGAPHCILPYSWNPNVTPWQMGIYDPNFPNQPRVLTVDPNTNKFRYVGSADGTRVYSGSASSGGRFHYMPWSIVNHRQRTPVWDAILLLLGGVVIIFGDSTEVASIMDENNNSLEGYQSSSPEGLRNKLLRVPGLTGDSPIKGAFYVGRQEKKPYIINPGLDLNTIGFGTTDVVKAHSLRKTMKVQPAVKKPVASDAPANAISAAVLMDLIRKNDTALSNINQPTDLNTIRTTLRGKNNGNLNCYMKRGMQGINIQGAVSQNENVAIGFERINTRENEINIKGDRARTYEVSIAHKLGAGKDFMNVKLAGIPSDANKPTQLNVQPGIGVFDVNAPGVSANAQVVVDGIINGRAIKSTFNVNIEDGMRMIIPELADPAQLKVGKIDKLFGDGSQFRMINRQ